MNYFPVRAWWHRSSSHGLREVALPCFLPLLLISSAMEVHHLYSLHSRDNIGIACHSHVSHAHRKVVRWFPCLGNKLIITSHYTFQDAQVWHRHDTRVGRNKTTTQGALVHKADSGPAYSGIVHKKQSSIILDKQLQWTWHLYCESFLCMWRRYAGAMAARAEYPVKMINLFLLREQWSLINCILVWLISSLVMW